MNRERRKRLAKAVELLEQAGDIIEDAFDEEQEAYCNLPESIQGAARGEIMESYIDLLDTAAITISDAVDHINDVINGDRRRGRDTDMKKKFYVTAGAKEKIFSSAAGVYRFLQTVNPDEERENFEAAEWCLNAQSGDQYIAESDSFVIEAECEVE